MILLSSERADEDLFLQSAPDMFSQSDEDLPDPKLHMWHVQLVASPREREAVL